MTILKNGINLNFITSWKTTLSGLIAIFIGAMQSYNDQTISAAIHDPKVQLAMIMGIGLMLAKDSNVTGGTKGQPSSQQALKDANQAPAQGMVLINGVAANVAPVPPPPPPPKI